MPPSLKLGTAPLPKGTVHYCSLSIWRRCKDLDCLPSPKGRTKQTFSWVFLLNHNSLSWNHCRSLSLALSLPLKLHFTVPLLTLPSLKLPLTLYNIGIDPPFQLAQLEAPTLVQGSWIYFKHRGQPPCDHLELVDDVQR